MTYVVLESQYQSSLTKACQSINDSRDDVCVECVGYLLEELRDAKNVAAFKKDVETSNIFIGSLIFVQVRCPVTIIPAVINTCDTWCGTSTRCGNLITHSGAWRNAVIVPCSAVTNRHGNSLLRGAVTAGSCVHDAGYSSSCAVQARYVTRTVLCGNCTPFFLCFSHVPMCI